MVLFTCNRNTKYAAQKGNGVHPDGLLLAHLNVAAKVFIVTVSGVIVVLGGAAPH